MIHIDRGHFCAHNDSRKYMLAARDIGYGSIIDNPVQHAEVLELLKDKLVPGAKVLDVGSGSGYLTTCFAHMVGKNGSVVGVEHIPEIVNHASNVTTLHYPKLNKRIKFICGDGRLGYPEGGPYDVIHVGASSEVVPKSLIAQLSSNNGSLFVPIGVDGPCNQTCWTKLNNGTVVEEIKQGAILYQDLCDKDYQMSEWFRDLMTTLVESDQDYVDPDKSYFSAIPSNETFEQYDPTNKWSTMWFTEAPLTRQSYKYPIPDHKSEQLRYESHIEK
ncbi:protein-L-isoaspartate(D-aspartate) O-methyltransferase-like isoform X1 [Diaphorina citri]|uniref:protein-L-isoaspartate(D-aspartate) O-methyltransferase n=1 Tax=Diaphorina citri TaxID=121845 RepID=A0A3Q0IL08_DIACI|nr:protein-L-isoaspartate(D-aspartate) O-methyltransferase-like isoform X1 [Diaphorina citri]